MPRRSRRRRTPGLRREEVAQLANISPTWYTWLEQGRGGAPSKEVLNRIASGLRLTAPEREHLFILAFGHPPENHFRGPDIITPRLQRVLDAMTDSPAIIKTVTWDVIAWNRAAAAVLTDYGALPREKRNILRLMLLLSLAIGVVLARTLLQGKRTRWQQSPFLLTASKSVPEDEESEKKE